MDLVLLTTLKYNPAHRQPSVPPVTQFTSGVFIVEPHTASRPLTTEPLHLIRQAIAWTQALQQHHLMTNTRGSLHPRYFLENDQGTLTITMPPTAPPLPDAMHYLSPEQIGKLPDIDIRSDLYSLGTILYEIISGEPPFRQDNPLDLAYQHLAVLPKPLSLLATAPQPLNDLVLRLLAKAPEARYASTASVLHDLAHCERILLESGTLPPFPLGQFERGSQFLIGTTLYGRETALATLKDIYARAVEGTVVLGLVSGYSGIGKSALVWALLPHVTALGGTIVEGKYDQYQRETPYTAIVEAFRGLLRRILSGTQTDITAWRQRISAILGSDGSVLTSVLPELVQLVGTQPPVTELTGAAAKTRFNTLFTSLLKEFANPSHPLVLFLDDLQWADSSSLALIRTFVREAVGAHLLLIGTYRDNEVTPDHPLAALIADIRADQSLFAELTIGPLEETDLSRMIADALHQLEDPDDLARYVKRHTHGNPFFTRQFLTHMVRTRELTYDPRCDRWNWIKPVSPDTPQGDVVALMHTRLRTYPDSTRNAMSAAACVGKRFSLAVLAQVLNLSADHTLMALAPVLQDELILAVTDTDQTHEFRFAHDRVRQAAYATCAPEAAQRLHLAIGLSIWRMLSPDAIHDAVFRIVDQLNLALPLITDPALRLEVARVNLIAAERAHASLAYEAELQYLRAGESCLPEHAWTAYYTLTYRYHLALAEACSVLSLEEPFQHAIRQLLTHVQTPFDRIRVRIRLTIHLCQSSQMTEGLTIGCQALAEVGIVVPSPEDTAQIHAMFDHEVETFHAHTESTDLHRFLMALPTARDPMAEQIHRLIGAMGDATTITNSPLLGLLGAIGSNISLTRGRTALSPLMYTLLGQGLVRRQGAYAEATTLANIALNTWEQHGQDGWTFGRMRVHQAWFILHWSAHIETILTVAEDALTLTRRAHDPIYGGYLLNVITIALAAMGRSTHEVLAAHARVVAHCKPFPAMDVIVGFTQCYAAAAAALRGETAALTSLDGAFVNERAFIERYRTMPMVLGLWQGARIPLLGLAGCWQEVLHAADSAELAASPPFIPHRAIRFWRGVACAEIAAHTAPSAREHYHAGLARAIQELTALAEAAQDNAAHYLYFLQAESAYLQGQVPAAIQACRQAIVTAGRSGFLIEEAYFNERLADWQEQTQMPSEHYLPYLQHAHNGYAVAQAYALQHRTAHRLHKLGVDPQTPANDPALDSVDAQAMARAMRAISHQVDLAPLLQNLLTLILDLSGADRGAIVHRHNDRLDIEYARGIYTPSRLPSELVQYVLNTGELVEQDRPSSTRSAHEKTGFRSVDEGAHFKRAQAASLFCLAIGRRRPAKRALYLEYARLSKSSWPARQEMLVWLSSQAATAIENAELYAQLEQRVQERTVALLEANDQLHERERALLAARDNAERMAQAKMDFLAHMSHEIRTPMSTIIGLADLAVYDPTPTRLHNNIKKIQLVGHHLMNVLDEVLNFSQLESGTIPIDHAPFLLDEIFRILLAQTIDRAEDKHLTLIWHIEPDVPRCLIGDALRITQVLLNFLNNALRHTDRGEITVSVSVERQEADSQTIRFAVRDTGPGIDPALHQTLFEEYRQITTDLPRRLNTTGLGLAISKRYAELMRGSCGLHSIPGQGATFWLSIPCRIGENPADSTLTATVRGRSVLLLEPHKGLRESLARNLKQWGMNVLALSSEQDALTALSAQSPRPDIVILACSVPQPDASRKILEDPRWPTDRTLLLLPQSRTPVENSGKGLLHAMTKPVLPHHVLEAAAARLGHASPEHYAPSAQSDREALAPLEAMHGSRILVVDDSILIREVAVGLLEHAGLRTATAENGIDAIAQLELAASQQDPYALVLMDWQMPVMDGLAATAQIRQRPEWAQLPIIAVTAHAMPDMQRQCLQAGMSDLVIKPFHPAKLWRTLAQWLTMPPKTPHPQATPPESEPTPENNQAQPILELIATLGTIPDLHPTAAMGFLPGKEHLYLSFLNVVLRDFLACSQVMAHAIDEGRWQDTARQLHLLSGNCAMLGTPTMGALAQTFEQSALQTQDGSQAPMLARSIHHLLTELTARWRAIAGHLSATQYLEKPLTDALRESNSR
ncbi:hypothetical protein B566_EDAN000415 [Ephemera danica]|nr:hypothetical protein B566_EDAN000415 [Ephemera danica]